MKNYSNLLSLPCSNAGSSSGSKTSESSASNKSNIFKNAFNKSLNFFSKIASSSGSPSTSTASTSSKPPGSDNHGSSSSETPSDCSSPDSLKMELGHFKPINREPRTPSSTNPKVVRVPTVRSVSTSTDFVIHSPCPSPFFIPITPRRESAFSFVSVTDEEKATKLAKPKAKKRSAAGPIKPPAKRLKNKEPETPKSSEKTSTGARRISAKPKVEMKTDVVARKTRSMDANQAKDVDHPKATPGKKKVPESKVFQVPHPKRSAKTTPKKKGQFQAAAKTVPAQASRSLRNRH